MQVQRDESDKPFFVRLLGTKRESFVEFEFAIGDSELSVELVMPFGPFMEFCKRYRVQFLEPSPEAAVAFDQLSCRYGSPDLEVPTSGHHRHHVARDPVAGAVREVDAVARDDQRADHAGAQARR